MKKYLLPKDGNFYKAAMHVHTNISDGGVSPEGMKAEYQKHGYSVVAFTDHEVFVPHNDLTEDGFLALNGVEISINNQNYLADAGGWPYIQTYHLNLYAKSSDIDYSSVCTDSSIYCEHSHAFMTERMKQNIFPKHYTQQSVNNLIEASNKDGFLVSYNHPTGSLQNYADYCDLVGLFGVECFNTGSYKESLGETIRPLEDLLHLGRRVMPLAGDDSHDLKTVGHCFNMIKAPDLSYDSIIKALTDGNFYASTGPEIEELYLDGTVLHIKCSDVMRILVTAERRVAFIKDTENYEKTVNSAEFDLAKFVEDSHLTEDTFKNAYFRITVQDAHGKEAYTRAYYLTEFFN